MLSTLLNEDIPTQEKRLSTSKNSNTMWIINVDKIDNAPNIMSCVFTNQLITNSNGYDCILAMTKFNIFYLFIYIYMYKQIKTLNLVIANIHS